LAIKRQVFVTAFFVDGITYIYGQDPLVADEPLLVLFFWGVFLGVGLG